MIGHACGDPGRRATIFVYAERLATLHLVVPLFTVSDPSPPPAAVPEDKRSLLQKIVEFIVNFNFAVILSIVEGT